MTDKIMADLKEETFVPIHGIPVMVVEITVMMTSKISVDDTNKLNQYREIYCATLITFACYFKMTSSKLFIIQQ